MTTDENMAMKIYRDALDTARDEEVEFRYKAGQAEYYNNTRLYRSVYKYLIKYMWDCSEDEKRIYIDIITDHLESIKCGVGY